MDYAGLSLAELFALADAIPDHRDEAERQQVRVAMDKAVAQLGEAIAECEAEAQLARDRLQQAREKSQRLVTEILERYPLL